MPDILYHIHVTDFNLKQKTIINVFADVLHIWKRTKNVFRRAPIEWTHGEIVVLSLLNSRLFGKVIEVIEGVARIEFFIDKTGTWNILHIDLNTLTGMLHPHRHTLCASGRYYARWSCADCRCSCFVFQSFAKKYIFPLDKLMRKGYNKKAVKVLSGDSRCRCVRYNGVSRLPRMRSIFILCMIMYLFLMRGRDFLLYFAPPVFSEHTAQTAPTNHRR